MCWLMRIARRSRFKVSKLSSYSHAQYQRAGLTQALHTPGLGASEEFWRQLRTSVGREASDREKIFHTQQHAIKSRAFCRIGKTHPQALSLFQDPTTPVRLW